MANRHEAAIKAAKTKRMKKAWALAHAAERASKKALERYCKAHGWHLAFFEGKTGAPRTGIIDAIAYRLGRQNADEMDLRLIQLKGGKAGVTGNEIRRLKEAALFIKAEPLIVAFDGKGLQFLPAAPD